MAARQFCSIFKRPWIKIIENIDLFYNELLVAQTYVGRYTTSIEVAGMSITTLKLNDNLKKHLLGKSDCPFGIIKFYFLKYI
jgi:hypothetical protein